MNSAIDRHIWRCRDHTFNLADHTLVMGILNVTPDSFSDGGEYAAVNAAVERALAMQEQGADIIDIGGESTRPGSEPVSAEQEIERVLPVLQSLQGKLDIPISIDTYKSDVAAAAIRAGASLINDISACRFDDAMAGVAASTNAGLVLMHIKGEPKNMQQNPHYYDVINEVISSLQESVTRVLAQGVTEAQIAIDPGIGFGKRLEHNFHILRELRTFEQLGRPILVGPSRKSFIGTVLNLPPDQRLEGTIAAATAAIMNGANIVRVHDVQQIKRAVDIVDAIRVNKMAASQ